MDFDTLVSSTNCQRCGALWFCPTNVVNGAESCGLFNLVWGRVGFLSERRWVVMWLNTWRAAAAFNMISIFFGFWQGLFFLYGIINFKDELFIEDIDCVIGILSDCVGLMGSIQSCNFDEHTLANRERAFFKRFHCLAGLSWHSSQAVWKGIFHYFRSFCEGLAQPRVHSH